MATINRRRSAYVVAMLIAAASAGCGEVQVAPDHRDVVLRLATATSARDQAMLEDVAAGVERLASAGKLTDGEARAFQSIIADARAGSWDRARDRAYELRDAQHPTAEEQERVAKRIVREIKTSRPGATNPP